VVWQKQALERFCELLVCTESELNLLRHFLDSRNIPSSRLTGIAMLRLWTVNVFQLVVLRRSDRLRWWSASVLLFNVPHKQLLHLLPLSSAPFMCSNSSSSDKTTSWPMYVNCALKTARRVDAFAIAVVMQTRAKKTFRVRFIEIVTPYVTACVFLLVRSVYTDEEIWPWGIEGRDS
jgi:hypothetical protein